MSSKKFVICLLFSLFSIALGLGCHATRHADLFTEVFDFKAWDNETRSFVANPPDTLLGNWSYTFSFCQGVNAYMGNIKNKQPNELMGWFMGVRSEIKVQNIPINSTDPAALEFTQISNHGDFGAPCSTNLKRSSKINVYCARKGKTADCSIVPGANSANCLPDTGDSTKNFCVCSVIYPYGSNPCAGLEINILSNVCPSPTRPPTPDPDPPAGAVFGLVLLGVFLIFVIFFVGGYIYNKTVLGLEGSQAIPLSTLCGEDAKEEYNIIEKERSVSETGTGTGTYQKI